MKKIVVLAGAGLLLGALAFAYQAPKLPQAAEEKLPTPAAEKAPSAPAEVPANPADTATAGEANKAAGDAVVNQLKSCCNEVRMTDTNKVAPQQAISKIQGCVGTAGGSWENDQVGGTAGQSLDKKWWQKGWGGKPEGCLTVSLHCSGDSCSSCTVTPSTGMRSYCSPFAK